MSQRQTDSTKRSLATLPSIALVIPSVTLFNRIFSPIRFSLSQHWTALSSVNNLLNSLISRSPSCVKSSIKRDSFLPSITPSLFKADKYCFISSFDNVVVAASLKSWTLVFWSTSPIVRDRLRSRSAFPKIGTIKRDSSTARVLKSS